MSATPRFWQSTSYEFPSAPPTAASTHSDLASTRQAATAFPRMSPSPVLTAASLRHPQQQVPSQRPSPALSAAVPAALATLREPSPVVSAPATPVLFAKELPLAPPQPQTPSNTSSALPGSSTASTPLLHPVPLGSHVVQQDMYHQRPLLYRHAHSHSRSDSISSTNNVFSPTSASSVSASNLSPSITTTVLSPATPHSRRTSLIATFTPSAVSAPMSPSSSYGLPSPTFPPRPLPGSESYYQPPVRPPRSPARPDRSGLSALTSIPPSPSPSNAQPFSYSAPIPRPNNNANANANVTVNGMGSMSRRNSRQVSVRLSAAFNAPPSMSGASSRATSRAPSALGGYGVDSFQYGSRGSAVGNGSDLEVLREGDVVGPGCLLRHEVVRAKSPGAESRRYEVMRKLGTGSYAVVYQVREILPPLHTPVSASYSPARPPQPVINEDVFDEEDVFGGFSSQSHAPSSLALALGPRRTSAPGRRRSSLLGPSPSPLTSLPGIGTSPSSPAPPIRYGSSFAIKVLSKASLTPDELAVQATEVTIHASLPAHPNIVTMHAAMETVDWLLLVLEYVPGEDLYYFLEQQREGGAEALEYEDGESHWDGSSSAGSSRRSSSVLDFDSDEEDEEETRGRRRHRHHHRRIREPRAQDQAIGVVDGDGGESAGTGAGGTPPTPSLLSSVHPAHMLSYGRLKLIASMFGQMCDAVQACHSQGISHRDIKPENFIVTNEDTSANSKTGKKKVIVKLSDFGLATTERFSADVDCGSAPYMSYECRNVVGPTYATQPADVWSLGIVLINMLYHHNLWHDTFLGDASFEAFRAAPIAFLMQRSPGMTHDVAEFLANRVFRVLPDAPPESAPAAVKAQYEAEVESVRVTAGEFGEWARNLPALFYAPGSGANPLMSTVSDVAVTAAEAIASRRSSLVEAGSVPHSPTCVFGQLQAAAASVAAAEEIDDDEDEEAQFAEKTFTQADAHRSSFNDDDGTLEEEDEDDSPVLPGLLVQTSPSTASSAPISPRSPRPQTPLPAEPMPLAQPVVDVKLDDAAESNSVLASSGGECLACSLDEHLGLGLSMITKKHSHDGNCTRDASASGTKRRRRGARKNKNASNAGSMPPSAVSSPRPIVMTSLPPHLAGLGGDHLEDLALDTQHLAREISRTRRAPSVVSTQPRQRSTSRSRSRAPSVPPHHVAVIPPPLPSMPSFASSDASTLTPGSDLPELNFSTPSLPPAVAAAQITKKSSKWNMNMFSSWRDRESNEEAATERATSLLKGLESTHHSPPASIHSGQRSQTSSSSSQFSHHSNTTSFTAPSVSTPSSTTIAFTPPPLPASMQQQQPAPAVDSESGAGWRGRPQQQQQARWGPSSPPQGAPVRSGLNDRWDRSPASSVYSSRSTATTVPTWRSQGTSIPASAASSMYNGSAPSSSASSTFTRFRNGSEMSFSTTATTVSASSVFNAGGVGVLGQQEKKKAQPPPSVRAPSVKSVQPPPAKSQRAHPVNVKQMSGIPWELDELPRNMFKPVNGKLPTGDIHGAPPQRRNKAVAPQALATINERPKGSNSRRAQSPGGESAESDGSGTPTEPQSRQQQQQPKKVQKAQINTLAKILTSFKAKRD